MNIVEEINRIVQEDKSVPPLVCKMFAEVSERYVRIIGNNPDARMSMEGAHVIQLLMIAAIHFNVVEVEMTTGDGMCVMTPKRLRDNYAKRKKEPYKLK